MNTLINPIQLHLTFIIDKKFKHEEKDIHFLQDILESYFKYILVLHHILIQLSDHMIYNKKTKNLV